MSSGEFELWMARDMVKADECPNCGVPYLEFMDWTTKEIKCSVCKQTHTRIVRWKPEMMGK